MQLYSEASLIRTPLIQMHLQGIRTHVWEPIMIVYIESDSLIWIFIYPDSQLGNMCPDKGGSTVIAGLFFKLKL